MFISAERAFQKRIFEAEKVISLLELVGDLWSILEITALNGASAMEILFSFPSEYLFLDMTFHHHELSQYTRDVEDQGVKFIDLSLISFVQSLIHLYVHLREDQVGFH